MVFGSNILIYVNFYHLNNFIEQHSDISDDDGTMSYGTYNGYIKASWPDKLKGTRGYITYTKLKNIKGNKKYKIRVEQNSFNNFIADQLAKCTYNRVKEYSIFYPKNNNQFFIYKIGETTCATFVAKCLYACLPASELVKLKDCGLKLKSISTPIELYLYLKPIL